LGTSPLIFLLISTLFIPSEIKEAI